MSPRWKREFLFVSCMSSHIRCSRSITNKIYCLILFLSSMILISCLWLKGKILLFLLCHFDFKLVAFDFSKNNFDFQSLSRLISQMHFWFPKFDAFDLSNDTFDLKNLSRLISQITLLISKICLFLNVVFCYIQWCAWKCISKE